MGDFKLTDEQQHVLDLFVTSDTLIVSALAGSGKTQTLLELAKANPNWDFGYLAFNKAIADEVHHKSPSNMEGRTIHSLAFGLHARPWRGRMNDKRRPNPNSLAKHLKTMPIMINDTPRGKKMLAAGFIASLAMKTVDRFCQTATNEITTRHVPLIPGIDPPGFYGNNRIAAAWVLPYAKAAWDDLTYDDEAVAGGKGGLMKFSFQHYLKLYQLSLAAWDGHADARYKGIRRNAWRKHCLLIDEAQDCAPVMIDIVERHDHAKLVLVGDRYQEIYGFTGAINAIAKFQERGHPTANLTGCFRFGPEIAEAGNYVLAELEASVRMRGLGGSGSIGAFADMPVTVLTRTNGGAMSVMARTLQDGGTPAFASEKLLRELKAFCLASDKLMQGHGTDHHDLCSFSSWAEVQDYAANDPMGDDLQVFVKIVDTYGPAKLSNLLDRCADASVADVVIGTAHSSKGKEFRNVRLHTDFPAPGPRMLEDEDLRLVYVAVTRAQSKLDIDGVEYFEEFLGVRAMDRPLGAGVIEGEVVDEMDEIGPEVVHSLPVEVLIAAMTEEANQDRSPVWPRVWS